MRRTNTPGSGNNFSQTREFIYDGERSERSVGDCIKSRKKK